MKTNYYYITKNYNSSKSAVGKAKIDCEEILDKIGFKNIGLQRTQILNSVTSFFLTLFGTLIGVIRLKKRSTICFQYPLKKYYDFSVNIAKAKHCKTITIIHDLRSLRKGKVSIESEIKSLNKNDSIISHNQKMTDWLKAQGLKAKIVNLNIFDYLGDGIQSEIRFPKNHKFNIVFAGVLSALKNNFIYNLDSLKPNNYKINLYGVGFNKDSYSGSVLDYKGAFKATEIINKIQGHFGLVWDGDSYTECSGAFGEYLMLNNPHKTSLYLRAGIPIITWDKAAIGDFIKENNIGIVISSFEELDERLSNLGIEEYTLLQQNSLKISKKIKSGHFFKNAISKCIE